MSESGYRPSINEIKEYADESLRKSRERREEEKNRKLSFKQKAARVGAAAGLAAATMAGAAALAHEAGEASVRKDMGIEYAGDIDKNVELSLLPDESYHVEENDSVEGIYHKLPFYENGFSLEAFKAEVQKRNPGLVGSEDHSDWTIYPNQGLNIPKLSE